MPKFFIKSENLKENEEIWITGNDVNHIKNVLRKNTDDLLNVCNSDTSQNYEVKIIKLFDDKIICKIISNKISNSESKINLTIYQGLPKADKMELIIQKCTELGVKEIVPTIMKRSVVKLKEKDKENKVNRWQKIAEVAAKQSGRDFVPKINNIINFNQIDYQKYDRVLVLYENENKLSIKQVINELKTEKILNLAIVIGPEGGFDEKEIQDLNQPNISIVTLGKRILRTETVALVVSGILMYELGDLN